MELEGMDLIPVNSIMNRR